MTVVGGGGSCAWGAGLTFFSSSWGDVFVNTDMTPEGREVTRPDPENPAYYRGRSLGCTFGSLPGDRLPDVKEMNDFIAAVLAKQGYVGATTDAHEPALFLVVQWGYLQPGSGELLWFLGYDARKDIGASVGVGLIGPEVYRRNSRSLWIDKVLDNASRPIYGIIVTAFEYKSARTSEPVIYWQTRIGLAANGKSMVQALPAMMLAAGPSMGRETETPVIRNADDVREGRVELGELEVIGFDEDTPAPPDQAAEGKR